MTGRGARAAVVETRAVPTVLHINDQCTEGGAENYIDGDDALRDPHPPRERVTR